MSEYDRPSDQGPPLARLSTMVHEYRTSVGTDPGEVTTAGQHLWLMLHLDKGWVLRGWIRNVARDADMEPLIATELDETRRGLRAVQWYLGHMLLECPEIALEEDQAGVWPELAVDTICRLTFIATQFEDMMGTLLARAHETKNQGAE